MTSLSTYSSRSSVRIDNHVSLHLHRRTLVSSILIKCVYPLLSASETSLHDFLFSFSPRTHLGRLLNVARLVPSFNEDSSSRKNPFVQMTYLDIEAFHRLGLIRSHFNYLIFFDHRCPWHRACLDVSTHSFEFNSLANPMIVALAKQPSR